ncbi:unnamed protein product, partial [Mesorhabditis belari]|uniref:Uncharacterized protein n=1 Tax=Mesorhabditis belari TaxID=2138241 RepID=A0AAF3EAT8_9BILA
MKLIFALISLQTVVTYPLCTTNTQCQPGFECLPIGSFHTCQPCHVHHCSSSDSCQTNLDCPANYQCAIMDETGRKACLEMAPPLPISIPRPLSCRRDSDCPFGSLCQMDLSGVSQCQIPIVSNGCVYNTDCRGNQVCVQNDNGLRRCLEAPIVQSPPCSMSQWCESGYLCQVNEKPMCITANCVSTSDCPIGKSCVQGFNQKTCMDNISEPQREHHNGCRVDSQCKSGFSCTVNGQRLCTENPPGIQRGDGGVRFGRWWSPCTRRSDCVSDLSCYTTLKNRKLCAAVSCENY